MGAGSCFADCIDQNSKGVSCRSGSGVKEREREVSTWGRGGGKGASFTYHKPQISETHLVLSGDLITHRAAKRHSSTRADKAESPLYLQTYHIISDMLYSQ